MDPNLRKCFSNLDSLFKDITNNVAEFKNRMGIIKPGIKQVRPLFSVEEIASSPKVADL